MKLGFTLKKPKKPTAAGAGTGTGGVFAASDKKEGEPAREFVTSFDPHAVELDASGHAKRALVIPLLRTNAWAEDADKADAEAASALLAEAAAGGKVSKAADETLVIPLSASAAAEAAETDAPEHKREVRARLFNMEAQQQQHKPVAPILRQNAVPGMDALADAGDKFRLDVSLRPDELDVHSEAYALVPVEDFGAALLRGMGWTGSVDADAADAAAPKPRHKLLGLGATARPPLPGDKAKSRHRMGGSAGKPSSNHTSSSGRPDDKPRSSGLNHNESSRRSRERDERDRRRRSPSSSSRDDRHGSSSAKSSSRSRDHDERRRSDDRRKRSRSRDSRNRDSRRDDDRKRSSRR